MGTINKQAFNLSEPAKASYGVGPTGPPVPSPTPSRVASRCTSFALSNPNGSCASFAKENDISLAQLHAWNTGFSIRGERCDKFEAGMNYCVGVSGPIRAPGPFQRGVIDTCIRYEKSSYADNRGDKCAAFAVRHGVALSDLYAWNKILKSECKHFLPDEYYCVAVAGRFE
jgi:hypothetical protein